MWSTVQYSTQDTVPGREQASWQFFSSEQKCESSQSSWIRHSSGNSSFVSTCTALYCTALYVLHIILLYTDYLHHQQDWWSISSITCIYFGYFTPESSTAHSTVVGQSDGQHILIQISARFFIEMWLGHFSMDCLVLIVMLTPLVPSKIDFKVGLVARKGPKVG